MADPITTIQTAAATVDAANSLLTSVLAFLPTAGYAITAAAAFLPKPEDGASWIIRFGYKAMTYIAFNVKHARNITDDRRHESAQEKQP